MFFFFFNNLNDDVHGGLFIPLFDQDTLELYLSEGIYGFLMPPVFKDEPNAKSNHYKVLADYACCREGTEVFFFLNRTIYYGGKIIGNKDCGSFYLNGLNSPLGRKANANLYWDESTRKTYESTDKAGVFLRRTKDDVKECAQPFLIQFEKNEMTGRYISSDDLYFKLGENYRYPLPSNSLQKMGFCTLTPGEVDTTLALISKSTNKLDYKKKEFVEKKGNATIFRENYISLKNNYFNEAELEFFLLSSLKPLHNLLDKDYVLCRQVPISPFKPESMDRADICLYDKDSLIKNGTIPNVIIELKKSDADWKAYEQVVRYLNWIKLVTAKDEFEKINAYIISPSFRKINKSKVSLTYKDKIKMYCLSENSFVELSD